MFQLENFIEIMCYDTEGWCKIQRKTGSWVEKWQRIWLIFMWAIESHTPSRLSLGYLSASYDCSESPYSGRYNSLSNLQYLYC